MGIRDLLEALAAAELALLDVPLAGYEHVGVFAAVETSVRWLSDQHPETARRYALLAAFESTELVPFHVIARFWGARSAGQLRIARRRVSDLVYASLLIAGPDDTFQLHDIHRSYLLAVGANVTALRCELLEALRSDIGWPEAAARDQWLSQRLVSLLVSSGGLDEAVNLIQAERPDGRNAWFELRSGADDLEGYWTDLDVLEHAVPALDIRVRPGVAARVAVIRSSLRAVSANTPGPLLAAAARFGIWPVTRLVFMVRRIPDANDRANAIIASSGCSTENSTICSGIFSRPRKGCQRANSQRRLSDSRMSRPPTERRS
jgi:hypothetical protein